ncbi:MAG: precorrin-3B C(17)-methyltransferase [Gemmataceae bacterium]|nr:precorrin-3B C(17)-methyltransferase [Gemmataceae bacterium]
MTTPTSTGRFWAIGVGPGDPELLTLKALRLVQAVAVIYHAGPEPRRGRAFEIIEPHLRPEQVCRIVLTEAMSAVSNSDWRTHYRAAVEQMASDCHAGRDVAFVTEGDPTLYSSAAQVWQLLEELHPEIPIEVVPGISSINAAAARVRWPLAQKDQPFAVVPAGYHAGELHQWIERFPSVCFLKPPHVLPELTQTLSQRAPQREAVYVENLGTAQEWTTTDLQTAAARNCYFSLVLVRTRPKSAKQLVADRACKAGQVSIIGLGPGDARLMTRQAQAALRSADVVVGYDAYLNALAPLHLRAEMCGSPIGAEAERARQSLEFAGQGRRVALVSSGDAGVYGMASLLFESAASAAELEIEVVPGVTAAVAAASLLGAPLGHDFACISLSDLLTPWSVIEQRLEAAAAGDFVLAIYNPLSQRRTWQLPRAKQILSRHRSPQTPVGLADRAYREGTRVWHTTLAELSTDGIGMETTLIVGNSQTRRVNGRMVTPRGYPASGGREPPEVLPASGGSRPPLARGVSPPLARGVSPPLANQLGRAIMEESFTIIDRELGPRDDPAWKRAVIRRMIHASADFDFAELVRHSPDFDTAFRDALRRQGAIIVTDTEMLLQGIRASCAATVAIACHLNDAEATTLAEAEEITRSAAGIRLAARHHPQAIVAIGNAPTALVEALRLIEEGWRPAALISMPVGFVGVEEAKARLLAQTTVPYLTCVGRKGGSAATAAAINALVEWSGRA